MTIPDSEGNTPFSIANPHLKKGFTRKSPSSTHPHTHTRHTHTLSPSHTHTLSHHAMIHVAAVALVFMNVRKEITSQLREGCGPELGEGCGPETLCPVPCNDILSEQFPCDDGNLDMAAMYAQRGATCHAPSTGTCHAPSTGTCHAPSMGTCHAPSTAATPLAVDLSHTDGPNDRNSPGPADQRSNEQGQRSNEQTSEQDQRSSEQSQRSSEQGQGSPEAVCNDVAGSSNETEDKNKVAKLEKKDTFSKEVEEGVAEDTPITQER